MEVPSVGDSRLEILHGGEGGDVELGARTSKHFLSLRLIHCLSNSLSFYFVQSIFNHIIHIACVALHLFILLIHIICLVVCVPHLYLTIRASYSTSTLI